jgi:tetratricopeptide (TPR) repeat protein
MTKRFPLARVGCAAALALALSACSTTAPVKLPDPPTLAEMLDKAGHASSTGNKEQAIDLWKQAATAFPADKSPWTHIAQTRYEAGQYGDAIQAALEVLVRDPNDKLANSIVAISGLRLATRAIGDLSRQNNLNGSLKSESQELAKLLRENLGESVLVPPPPAPPVAQRERPVRTAKKKAARSDSSASANPFQALN